jgi:hypothetical protein
MTAVKSCFGRDFIECYYLALFEGKMRMVIVKAGMMIRARQDFY